MTSFIFLKINAKKLFTLYILFMFYMGNYHFVDPNLLGIVLINECMKINFFMYLECGS